METAVSRMHSPGNRDVAREVNGRLGFLLTVVPNISFSVKQTAQFLKKEPTNSATPKAKR
ncbi:hypothetical protein StoSoilA2_34300 [Arthrobacter sp. StoSoilA2]|nr:hypothetical protein StoSoilA2_34300 [Arthrobacter sp. StoSoilA2]